jgi:hypothetical protein
MMSFEIGDRSPDPDGVFDLFNPFEAIGDIAGRVGG